MEDREIIESIINRVSGKLMKDMSEDVGVLEKEAWNLAMKYSNNEEEGNATKLKEKAEELKQNIEEFADRLKKADSDLTKRFARIISEALLDCEYVISNGQVASLRMSRILRQRRTK